MGHGRGKSASSSYTPAPIVPPVADYNVTGDPNPDCRCNYFEAGVHNGKPYYRRIDGAYFIWWNGVDAWIISLLLGDLGAGIWQRIDPNIEGLYQPIGAFFGNPTVAAGPH